MDFWWWWWRALSSIFWSKAFHRFSDGLRSVDYEGHIMSHIIFIIIYSVSSCVMYEYIHHYVLPYISIYVDQLCLSIVTVTGSKTNVKVCWDTKWILDMAQSWHRGSTFWDKDTYCTCKLKMFQENINTVALWITTETQTVCTLLASYS